jgi:4-amino-4-deoxy-L-arabinose transferase-like glycosyltransferase
MTDQKTHVIKHLILLLIVIVPLFSLGLSNHGLWSADEPRVAEIGREMVLTGNWTVPTLNQKPFLEEPPLYYASLALVFKIFGVSDKVARIPSAFFAFAAVLVVFFMANLFFGPRVALLSGLILSTSGEYFRVAHWVIVDSALTFFVISALYSFIMGYLSETNRKKVLCYILLYVACTLAFYTKGFIGIVIPGLGILVFLIIERNFKEIFKMKLWLGVLIFLAMTLPWFIALWQHGGAEHLKVFFLHNHLQRFFPSGYAGTISGGAASGHHHPFYYYITEFPSGFLPWSLLLIPVLFHAFSKSDKPGGIKLLSEKGTLLSKCWFFAGIVFLSIASTKRTLYLMPIFAPFAMLTAAYIDSMLESPQSLTTIGKVFTWVFSIVLLFVGFALTPICLYMKKLYPMDVSGTLLILIVVFSVFMIALSVAAIRYFQQKDIKKYWISMNISIIFMLFFAVMIVIPILDNHKSFVPFCRQIAVTVPVGEPLYAYRPDETLLGAVPFYTGHYVIETENLQGITPLLEKNEPFFIMIRDKKEQTEKELLNTGKLFVHAKQMMGTDRTLVLLSDLPPKSAVTIGNPYREIEKVKGDMRLSREYLLQLLSDSLERT